MNKIYMNGTLWRFYRCRLLPILRVVEASEETQRTVNVDNGRTL
jgi:predicted ribosome-associated RNA-binding protein Tma20